MPAHSPKEEGLDDPDGASSLPPHLSKTTVCVTLLLGHQVESDLSSLFDRALNTTITLNRRQSGPEASQAWHSCPDPPKRIPVCS